MNTAFEKRLTALQRAHDDLLSRQNSREAGLGNGVYDRYLHPVLTAGHVPLAWRYDFNAATNPWLMERFGVNAVFNAGALKFGGRYVLAARVEGVDRKSFFALAESENGTDGFRFWDEPLLLPPSASEGETNVYDMRLVEHQDGWVYGLFCTERRDPRAAPGEQSAAVAQCGIVRTRDLRTWERLADLKTPSPQQRNVVLHPEFVQGRYAFYTRPQDGFITTGRGGGIGFGLSETIENAVINEERVIDPKVYHTVYEAKNGLGPQPLKTAEGWLHLAHGVRATAAGLRYTLYLFMTALDDLTRVIYKPGGYFLAPEGEERVGDVSNVVFSNGWIRDEDGRVFIYYASSDTRTHVATTTLDQLLDYVINTPPDGLTSAASVQTVHRIIAGNKTITTAQQQESIVSPVHV